MEAAQRVGNSQNSKNKIVPVANTSNILTKISVVAGAALVAFLLGLVPMWTMAHQYEKQRDAAVKTLRPSVLQNNLATAAMNARRGEYEQARQQVSDFFTDLRAESDSETSAFNSQQSETVKTILAQRDETITMLARSDVASAERLANLYFSFMEMKNSQAAENN